MHVIHLGVAGGIPGSIDPTLTQLGVNVREVPKVRRVTQKIALRHTHKVVQARRTIQGTKQRRPPQAGGAKGVRAPKMPVPSAKDTCQLAMQCSSTYPASSMPSLNSIAL